MIIAYYYKHFSFLFFYILLFIFISIEFVLPELLNNIIRLGDNQFRYSHFSFNSDGDMIIDSESYPSTRERRFFGLKKNGKFYFNDSNNQTTPYYSIYSGQRIYRLEGESNFIKFTNTNSELNGRKLFFYYF